jgi:hypothetical protein
MGAYKMLTQYTKDNARLGRAKKSKQYIKIY